MAAGIVSGEGAWVVPVLEKQECRKGLECREPAAMERMEELGTDAFEANPADHRQHRRIASRVPPGEPTSEKQNTG